MMTSWKTHRLAYSSFAISGVVMLIFLSAILLVRTQFDHPTLIKKAIGIAWLFGTPTAFLLALAGLFRDSRRGAALLALTVALVFGLFCTLQMLV
jgi:membrane protein CcdC involved in cytochrome C biogenesis